MATTPRKDRLPSKLSKNNLNAFDRKGLGQYFFTYCAQFSYGEKPHIHWVFPLVRTESFPHQKHSRCSVSPATALVRKKPTNSKPWGKAKYMPITPDSWCSLVTCLLSQCRGHWSMQVSPEWYNAHLKLHHQKKHQKEIEKVNVLDGSW